MIRKLIGVSGLALLIVAALAMVNPSSAKSGLTAVGDDVAVSVSGGQYCPLIYYVGNYGCGQSTPVGKCPYCPTWGTGQGTYCNIVSIPCYVCGYPCGYCNATASCVGGS
jgi:hypothetical protein